MITNNHQHIMYDEIKKYTEANEESFTLDSLIFFKEFEQRIDNCQTCGKRFKAYHLLSSFAFAGEELFTEDVTDEPHGVEVREKIEDFLNKLRTIGELVYGGFTIIPLVMPIASRGIEGESNDENVISIIRGDNGGDDLIKKVIVKESEEFFEFELFEPTELAFTMPIEITEENTYELVLCHEMEGEKGPYPINIETFHNGEKGAETDELPIGKYIGAVIRGDKGKR